MENRRNSMGIFNFVRSIKSQFVDFFAGHQSQETRIDTAFPQQLMKTFIWQQNDGSKYIVVLSNQLELVTKIALNESGAVQLREAIDSYILDQKQSP
jgi:hypothetical protein